MSDEDSIAMARSTIRDATILIMRSVGQRRRPGRPSTGSGQPWWADDSRRMRIGVIYSYIADSQSGPVAQVDRATVS
jgi:hypothetical protein